jgi:hypothetical protein
MARTARFRCLRRRMTAVVELRFHIEVIAALPCYLNLYDDVAGPQPGLGTVAGFGGAAHHVLLGVTRRLHASSVIVETRTAGIALASGPKKAP